MLGEAELGVASQFHVLSLNEVFRSLGDTRFDGYDTEVSARCPLAICRRNAFTVGSGVGVVQAVAVVKVWVYLWELVTGSA